MGFEIISNNRVDYKVRCVKLGTNTNVCDAELALPYTLYSCIVQQKPHKRTVYYNNKKYFIDIPFYTIFNIFYEAYQGTYINAVDAYKKIGRSYYIYSKIGGSEHSVSNLDNSDIYPILYPHVSLYGHICQYGFETANNLDDYVNKFISNFWSSENSFYMKNNFSIINTSNLILYNNSILLLDKLNFLLDNYIIGRNDDHLRSYLDLYKFINLKINKFELASYPTF